MSEDFLETIWAQYAVETEEHIESIEDLLVKADAQALNAEKSPDFSGPSTRSRA